MPTDYAKVAVNDAWVRQRRSRHKPPPRPPREAEIEAMARFVAERGIIKLPPVDSSPGAAPLHEPTSPRAMPAWKE